MKVKRVHLHEGNSTRRERHGHKFVTITKIFDDEGNLLAEGKAYCSRRDNPSRKLGREIADGRAWKKLEESRRAPF